MSADRAATPPPPCTTTRHPDRSRARRRRRAASPRPHGPIVAPVGADHHRPERRPASSGRCCCPSRPTTWSRPAAGSAWTTTAPWPRTRTSARRCGNTLLYTALYVPLSMGLGLPLGAGPEPAHPARRAVPHADLRPVRHLGDGPGRAVLVHPRPASSASPTRCCTTSASPRRDSSPIPARRCCVLVAHLAVERHRLLRGRLSGRAPGRTGIPPRSGAAGRRRTVAAAAACHPAHAHAGHRLPAAVADHQLPPGLRPRVRDDQGRAARLDHGDRLLHLGAGLQELHRRLRRGGGLCARARPARHRPSSAARTGASGAQDGTASPTGRRAAGAPARPRRRSRGRHAVGAPVRATSGAVPAAVQPLAPAARAARAGLRDAAAVAGCSAP